MGCKWALGLLMVFAACANLDAQQQRNRPRSPGGSSATEIGGDVYDPVLGYSGGKWIEVTYSRPMLRGRTDIFGKGADYGKKVTDGEVWRAGANQTTRIKSDVPLTIGGNSVDLGLCTPANAPVGLAPITDGAPVSAADFDTTFPYLATPLPGAGG